MGGFHTIAGAPPDSLSQAKTPGPGAMIKFAPLALADFQTAAMFAIHYKVKGSMYFQNEAGLVFPISNESNYRDYQDMWGVRNRFEIRNYFKAWPRTFAYASVELIYNNATYWRNRIKLASVSGLGQIDYFQYVTYRVRKQAAAFHVKIGWEHQLYPWLYMDLYAGLGARGVFIRSKGVEEGNYWDPYLIFPIHDHGNFLRPSGSLGFKLGYVIGKKNEGRF